ncbi:hypothetical protein VTN96DRAFT_1028 [Rasamsonia emersonii]
MHRPSSLVARHLHIAAVVLVLVLNRRDAVHRGRVLELDLLGGARGGALLGVLLEDALGRTGVGVRVAWLQRRILARVGWAHGRRRHRRPGHGARQARRAERLGGALDGRDAQRELGPGSSCGVHFRKTIDEKAAPSTSEERSVSDVYHAEEREMLWSTKISQKSRWICTVLFLTGAGQE